MGGRLTLGPGIDIFRGFREYLEPAVRKRLGGKLDHEAFAKLDTRDVLQDLAE
jgi:hypothetical protein